MSYTARLSITIPAALYDVACAIARALDTDSGGDKSFGPKTRLDENGDEYTPSEYVASGPCHPEFAEQAITLAGNAAMLHAVVSADYATRWPDLTPPTLAECQAFCDGAVVVDLSATPATPETVPIA